jgi:hypothetical protein
MITNGLFLAWFCSSLSIFSLNELFTIGALTAVAFGDGGRFSLRPW